MVAAVITGATSPTPKMTTASTLMTLIMIFSSKRWVFKTLQNDSSIKYEESLCLPIFIFPHPSQLKPYPGINQLNRKSQLRSHPGSPSGRNVVYRMNAIPAPNVTATPASSTASSLLTVFTDLILSTTVAPLTTTRYKCTFSLWKAKRCLYRPFPTKR